MVLTVPLLCSGVGSGLEAPGDLAELPQFVGQVSDGPRLFVDGIASDSASLDGIRLLVAEEGGSIVLVAIGIATGNGEGAILAKGLRMGRVGERVEEVEEVVGILADGVEANVKMNGAALGDDGVEASAEFGIAVGILGEGAFGGGVLEVVAKEHGVVAIASGVGADPDGASGRFGSPSASWRRGTGRNNWHWIVCGVVD